MSRPGSVPARVAITFAILAFTLEVASLVFYAAATGFPLGLNVPTGPLLGSGPGGAELIRVGSLVDMFGYLCIPAVVLYLRDRYAGARLIDLYAVAGLLMAAIGAIGAVLMAAAAPALIEHYNTASAAGQQAIEPVFGTLYRGVVDGMWQTLETIPAAAWLLGTAFAARRDPRRAVVWTLLVLGLVYAAIAVDRLAGL